MIFAMDIIFVVICIFVCVWFYGRVPEFNFELLNHIYPSIYAADYRKHWMIDVYHPWFGHFLVVFVRTAFACALFLPFCFQIITTTKNHLFILVTLAHLLFFYLYLQTSCPKT
jgi:hypothetical protein